MPLSFSSFAINNNINELHTLFTSRQTRHKLNVLRDNKNSPITIIKEAPTQANFNFQGIVIKANKPPIIFLNDKTTSTSKIFLLKNYQLKVSVGHKYIYLKPGEKWHRHLPKHKNASLQFTPED